MLSWPHREAATCCPFSVAGFFLCLRSLVHPSLPFPTFPPAQLMDPQEPSRRPLPSLHGYTIATRLPRPVISSKSEIGSVGQDLVLTGCCWRAFLAGK